MSVESLGSTISTVSIGAVSPAVTAPSVEFSAPSPISSPIIETAPGSSLVPDVFTNAFQPENVPETIGSIDTSFDAQSIEPSLASDFDSSIDRLPPEPFEIGSIDFKPINLFEPPRFEFASNFSPEFYAQSEIEPILDLTPIGNKRFAMDLVENQISNSENSPFSTSEVLDSIVAEKSEKIESLEKLQEITEITQGWEIVEEVSKAAPVQETQPQIPAVARFAEILPTLTSEERQELRQIARTDKALYAIGTLPKQQIREFMAPAVKRYLVLRKKEDLETETRSLIQTATQVVNQPQVETQTQSQEEVEEIVEVLEKREIEEEIITEVVMEEKLEEAEVKAAKAEVVVPRIDKIAWAKRVKVVTEFFRRAVKKGEKTISVKAIAALITQKDTEQKSGLVIKRKGRIGKDGTIELGRKKLSEMQDLSIAESKEVIIAQQRVIEKLAEDVPVTDEGDGYQVDREDVKKALSEKEAIEITTPKVMESRRTEKRVEWVKVEERQKKKVAAQTQFVPAPNQAENLYQVPEYDLVAER